MQALAEAVVGVQSGAGDRSLLIDDDLVDPQPCFELNARFDKTPRPKDQAGFHIVDRCDACAIGLLKNH